LPFYLEKKENCTPRTRECAPKKEKL